MQNNSMATFIQIINLIIPILGLFILIRFIKFTFSYKKNHNAIIEKLNEISNKIENKKL